MSALAASFAASASGFARTAQAENGAAEETVEVVVGGKKRRRDSGESKAEPAASKGKGGARRLASFRKVLAPKNKKSPSPTRPQAYQPTTKASPSVLGADAAAKMAERKAQREKMRELRERSPGDAYSGLAQPVDGSADVDPGSRSPLGSKAKKQKTKAEKKQEKKERKERKKQEKREKKQEKKERKRNKDPSLKGNELFAKWQANQQRLPADFPRLLDPALDEERRGDLFEAEDEDAQTKYAWAIPDERALRICASYAPLVEMGAGAGYWARLLRDRGVVVEPFDCDVGASTRAAGVAARPWTAVQQGGPEVLPRFPDSALLLMYPDDLESHEEGGEAGQGTALSVLALEAYEGDTVIHVGELFGDTLTVSMEGQEMPDTPYPWGRSTQPAFQVRSRSLLCLTIGHSSAS